MTDTCMCHYDSYIVAFSEFVWFAPLCMGLESTEANICFKFNATDHAIHSIA